MKRLLSIILLAAALAASPAAGQTIKSLGYNTTNGNIVAATNVTFTNSVGFATNARAATRTNLGLGATWLTNTNVTNFRTAVGLGATNEVTFGSVRSSGLFVSIGTNDYFYAADDMVEVYVPMTTYGISFATNVAAATTRTNLGLGATNNVTFSNITASGTLAVTGDTVLSGVNNLMPNATNAASASSLMTRELTDVRMVNFMMEVPNRFRNLSHAIASQLSGPGTAVHAGPISEGRVNVRIVNGSTNSFARVTINRQGPWNGIEGQFGIDWSRPMNVVVMGSKSISTSNVTRAYLVFGAGAGDTDVPTNGNWVALNWTNATNAQVLVSASGVVTTNATNIVTSAAPAGFGLWIDHSTNGTGDIYYAERNSATNAALAKPATPTSSYVNGPAVASTNQTSLTFGILGLSTNTGSGFEIIGLNNAIFFAP